VDDIKTVALRVYENYCSNCNKKDIWPRDDTKLLANFIRDIVNELQYYQCCQEEGVEDWVVDARKLYDLADSLDVL
jgi:hypothetical protein